MLSMVWHKISYSRTNHQQSANLLDNTEAIIIVTMEYVRTHECEDWHDVV